ncbi:hypothetical protein GQ600_24129 [Phytophthora cactorum]|nr:hypothetical protein GQ600_24129 [Phytophthora cactorum]
MRSTSLSRLELLRWEVLNPSATSARCLYKKYVAGSRVARLSWDASAHGGICEHSSSDTSSRPSTGMACKPRFWIRSGILSFMVVHTLTTQATYLIDGVVISVARMIALSACASILFTAFAVEISAWLLFPMPFFVLTLALVFYVALILSYRLVLGTQILHQMIENRDQLIRYSSFVAAQNVMVLTYPAYETLFRVAKGSLYQLPVILLLPFIKVAVKNMVLRCMASMEDMLPEA